MSKIFAESLGQTLKAYSKRFAVSVTDFANKYQYDPFFRTEVNVVALQVAFSALLLIVVSVTAKVLYHDASLALSRGIEEALSPGSAPGSISDSVAAELASMRSRTVVYATAVIIAVTLILSYIITRIALLPTRNALESQKQFIGNVAHELRTPLSVIKTNTEVALMSAELQKDMRATFDSTVEELDRISEIINNLLSLSASIRPERIEFKDIDLGEVVRGVIEKLQSLTDSKRLEVTARMSERRVVWGNAIALEQVVMNVLKNAIIHTPRSGRILVTVEPVHPDHMELTIQDFGAGIARKDLFRIFEPYYRGDPSRRRGSGGSGLGLTIVSELVKLHNGKITVRSAEQRGTIVTIQLPAGQQSLSESGAAERQRENVSEIAVDFSRNGNRTGNNSS